MQISEENGRVPLNNKILYRIYDTAENEHLGLDLKALCLSFFQSVADFNLLLIILNIYLLLLFIFCHFLSLK